MGNVHSSVTKGKGIRKGIRKAASTENREKKQKNKKTF